jgi:hypothetical protein
VAIALLATPLFFQLTQLYSAAARDEIRALLRVYKAHREAIYRGYVFPIGAKPDNASWTGFQCHLPDEGAGYLTLFRELYNRDAQQALRLHFLSGRAFELEDLRSGERSTMQADAEGSVTFTIGSPAGFGFYRYSAR